MKQIWLDLRQPYHRIDITEPTEVLGVFVGTDYDYSKVVIDVVHTKPDLNSLTLIKAVLFDHAKVDIEGKLIINKGARQTDTYLKAAVLMLSPHANARAVPSLEIMEDNVKGGHGATVGKVDPEELFYLQSRGLNRIEATKILVDGFLGEVFSKATDKEVQSMIEAELSKLPGYAQ